MTGPFPPQPPGVAWPTGAWPTGEPSPAIAAAVDRLTSRCLAEPETYGLHLALVVVQGGRLVAETYGPTAAPDTALVSWSMAKSVVHAAVGLCVGDGLLRLDDPAPVPEWAGDARSAITLDHLLAMCDGLDFVEDYVDAGRSDVIEMLFGAGKADVAAFAVARPAAHAPGTVWNYSSGTTNVVARIVGDVVARRAGVTAPGERAEAVRGWLRARLFGPLGMTSADPRVDEAGTFVGSSFLYATARDFARFGLLYLRDGVWDGRRILPEGWSEHARTPAPAPVSAEEGAYGRHWWLHDPYGLPGAFGAHGYEGQYTIVVPDRDLVVVRLGKTSAEQRPALSSLLREVLAAAAP